MSLNVDPVAALALLRKAANESTTATYTPKSPHATFLKNVITGPHLTYRYVLITAILAKATKADINPLALQANAPISGAYDARSLCHSVIAPNEVTLLHSSLGSSNEPYLNKPARTPFLSPQNPVRGGNDKKTLEALCEILPKLNSSRLAYEALCDAIFFAISTVKAREIAVTSAVSGIIEAPTNVRDFLSALVTETHHGETTVLVTALLYWLLSKFKKENWTIEVHPVNEAGSSSNQIGDIDIYNGQELLYTCEVKDKVVIGNDIQHAIRKASEAQSESLHLVFGKSGSLTGITPGELHAFAAQNKVALTIFNGSSLIESSALWTPIGVSLKEIAVKSLEITEVARMKQATQKFLLKTIQSFASDNSTQ